jgi:DNA-binding transcriptional MerR regulator
MSAREQFTREEVQRLADVSEAQLSYWERLGLLEPRKSEGRRIYDFRDLISLRTAKQLIREGVPAHKLRRALVSLEEKLSDVKAPLTELRIVSDGKDLVVEHDGARMEPLSGQLILNFDTRELSGKLREFPQAGVQPEHDRPTAGAVETRRTGIVEFPGRPAGESRPAVDAPQPLWRQRDAGVTPDDWMTRAEACERRGTRAEAIAAYENVLAREPRRMDAWINLGTLYYEHSEFQRAFDCFRRASEIESGNALALYNVGCVLEDLNQVHSAREYLRAAVRLDPAFADAHYNLALVCERLGAAAEAAPHWRRYLELDPTSPWCDYARQRLRPHVV